MYGKQKFGFTLIEVLITVTIIGLLSSLIFFSYENAQQKARDHQRKQDISYIQAALNLYYQDNGAYPLIAGGCCEDINIAGSTLETALVPKYVKALPKPPNYDAVVYHSRYSYDNCCPADSSRYRLYSWLENPKDPKGVPAEGSYLYMTLPPN